MHLAVIIPNGLRDEEIARRASRENLWLWPLSPNYIGGSSRQGFVLGFGCTQAADMPGSVRRLKSALK
jgi:DNA-binding transcriptional MocR family regulator